ncbi:MAG: DUF2149 domain-containing protein [Bacteroidetes bacterium]|nr:MAG: DUF2149 domain-containing protein [Bacteroidota bacterium]
MHPLIEDDDDPMLSLVNLIDVFLVIVIILFVVLAQSPLQMLAGEDVTVIRNAGKADMEILIKEGEKLTHYRASDEIGTGRGTRAGVTYRLDDGTLVYVPESLQP